MQWIALIPARSGSKRVPGKNMRHLVGHPLLIYTVLQALDIDQLSYVLVSTDSEETAQYVKSYSASHQELGCDRRVCARLVGAPCHTDGACDILWVQDALHWLAWNGYLKGETGCALLRPTSPFRQSSTIVRAMSAFGHDLDSARAVRRVTEGHPYKMWRLERGGLMSPLHDERWGDGTPYHSSPTQGLPPVFVQTSALELFWSTIVRDTSTITGKRIGPIFMSDLEGFSIDTEVDWQHAEHLAASGALTADRDLQRRGDVPVSARAGEKSGD